jgi:hypothetical protein
LSPARTAVLYYRLVWGVIPELVIALDHCRDLYCDFTRQYYPTAREVLISGQPSRGYFYSSFFALLLAPFGRLELEPAVGWWSLVQLAGILLLLLPGVDFYRQSRAAWFGFFNALAPQPEMGPGARWSPAAPLPRFFFTGIPPLPAFGVAVKYYVPSSGFTSWRRDYFWSFFPSCGAIPTAVLGLATCLLCAAGSRGHEHVDGHQRPICLASPLAGWALFRLVGLAVFGGCPGVDWCCGARRKTWNGLSPDLSQPAVRRQLAALFRLFSVCADAGLAGDAWPLAMGGWWSVVLASMPIVNWPTAASASCFSPFHPGP